MFGSPSFPSKKRRKEDDGDDSLEHACLVVLKMIALVRPVLGSPLLSSNTLKNDVAEFTTD